ncbi:NACHT, LRR and PYD domains-containing protein 4 [Glossophaga mutica]
MASSFFSEFGLMWYLGELRKDEFRKFKELLKEAPVQLGLQQMPWADVKKGTREDLANLLAKHYGEEQAWDVTFLIFQKINRKDLCDKAKKEITGHAKTYRAYVEKKFTGMWFRNSITRICDHFQKKLAPKECECLDGLFAPKGTGTRTVVLKGLQGIGKTTVLMKLMLSWAEGALYQKFSYVFYFCCREMKQMTVTSLAALICRGWSNSVSPITEITSDPEKLLFIIDGFEELSYDLDEPDSDLCSDWMEQRPIRVILSSLLRKKMLPEASLLIALAPKYPQSIENRLESPESKVLRGFREWERKLYFCCLFQDKNRGIKAFSLVRENEQLLSMCEIPILCWSVGTCLKQEMEKGRDLAVTCRRTTSLYSSFVLNLFTPKGAAQPDRQGQGRLMGLCSLAAEGMWTDMFVFTGEDLRRNGLVDSDIPALLEAKALHRHWNTENSYSFIHLCLQEICAALFYFGKGHTDHPHPAVASTETLLSTFLSKVKIDWVFLGCFLFGLLSEKERQKLEAFFGPHLRQQEMPGVPIPKWRQPTMSPDIARCPLGEGTLLPVVENHEYQMTKGGSDPRASNHLDCWYRICSVLTTNKNLRELQVNHSNLQESPFVILSSQLRHPRCRLEKLWLGNCGLVPEDCEGFGGVLQENTKLKILNLSCNYLDTGMSLLCEALCHPTCPLHALVLTCCYINEGCWECLPEVLLCNKALFHLDFSTNVLRYKDLNLLCEALTQPGCCLKSLCLINCFITTEGCRDLALVLTRNSSLRNLQISYNDIGDDGARLLCKALIRSTCHLQMLGLGACNLTGACCEDLASVLINCRTLRRLALSGNALDHQGVLVLCQALRHPLCRLQWLG